MKVTLIDREKCCGIISDDARYIVLNDGDVMVAWEKEINGVRTDTYDFVGSNNLSITIIGVRIEDDQLREYQSNE